MHVGTAVSIDNTFVCVTLFASGRHYDEQIDMQFPSGLGVDFRCRKTQVQKMICATKGKSVQGENPLLQKILNENVHL